MLVKRAWHIVGYLAPVKESYIGSTPVLFKNLIFSFIYTFFNLFNINFIKNLKK